MKKIVKCFAAVFAAVGLIFAFTACGEYEETHNFKETVVSPTCTEGGYTLYECTDDGCEYSYIDNRVPALGHAYDNYFCTRCFALDKQAPDTEGLEYTPVYESDGVTIKSYAVTGTGEAQIANYIKVPDKFSDKSVTGVSDGAFKDLSAVKAIELPSTVKEMGDRVFAHCVSLKSVVLPDVNQIGEETFKGCSAIESVDLPTRTERVEARAFENCASLENVKLPNALRRIESDAFKGCVAIKSVDIPVSAEYIAFSAFEGCNALEQMTLPMSAARTAEVAGEDKPKTEYMHFGYIFGAETPEQNAEFVPASLETVNIIGFRQVTDKSFAGCQMSSVVMSGGVNVIGEGAFKDCDKLASVEIAPSASEIGDGAFENCSALKAIQIPSSATRIGFGAFTGCTAIERMTLPMSTGRRVDIGGGLMQTEYASHFGFIFGAESYRDNASAIPAALKSVRVAGRRAIGENAFYGCPHIETVEIEGTVRQIGKNAFGACEGLLAVRLEKGMTNVGGGAFYDCQNLEELTLYSGIKNIGAKAFYGCTSLKTVNFKGTIAEFGATKYEDEYSSPIAYSADLIIGGHKVNYK